MTKVPTDQSDRSEPSEPHSGSPEGLTTLGMSNPIGIGERAPTFRWKLSPAGPHPCAAHQVQVATTVPALQAGDADLWDSGEVAGTAQHSGYAGTPLASRSSAHWRVRVRGADEVWSPWSEPGHFELGLLDPSEWTAEWITDPQWSAVADGHPGSRDALPLLAGEFTLESRPVRARLHVAGVGVYYATVNGAAVSDAVLEPAYSDFRSRVCSATHDVTDLLVVGPNVLGLELGPGIALVTDPGGRYTKYVGTQVKPQGLAQLEVDLADGSFRRFGTDATWVTAAGPTTYSHWYGGEDFDARKVIPGWNEPAGDRSAFRPVALAPALPTAPRTAPPVRIVDRRPATLVSRDSGLQVFDVGVVQAGWAQVRVDLPSGHAIVIRPGDQLDDQGRVLQTRSTTGVDIVSTLTAGSGPTTWHPRFRYDGFRYVQIEGLPDDAEVVVTALVLRAGNDHVGGFSTSVPLVNDIHGLIDRAVQSNMFSVLTDCPHREKLGWLEETHLLFDVVAYNYDCEAYFRELQVTIAETQRQDGLVPCIAPEFVVFDAPYRDDVNWGSALIQLPWQHYRWYGDPSVLTRHYDAMRAYADYLGRQEVGGLLTYGLGDWITTDDSTPVPLVASWGYWRAVTALADVARVLARPDHVAEYSTRAAATLAAFHAEFCNPTTGSYGNGGQASELFALDLGAPSILSFRERVDRICASIDVGLDVGEIALPTLFRVLAGAGRHDTLWRFANSVTHPSYGFQVVHGATSLTEAWDGPTGRHSQNHFMLGAIDSWFYRHLGGIAQEADSIGWQTLRIAPILVDGLMSVTARTRLPRGEVSVAWELIGNDYHLEVNVPAGSSANVTLPAGSGTVIRRPQRADARPAVDGLTTWQVPGGRWSFTARR